MLQICTALLAAEVNITQIYPLLFRPTRQASGVRGSSPESWNALKFVSPKPLIMWSYFL